VRAGDTGAVGANVELSTADRDVIVREVPRLAARVEELERALRAARHHISHHPGCPEEYGPDGNCLCGAGRAMVLTRRALAGADQ